MKDFEIDSLVSEIKGLWPRAGHPKLGWSDMEWSVLDEQAARIEINSEQASAALRNLKATSDKYPNVKLMLDALKRAENRPSVGPASALPPTLTRIGDLRKRLVAQGHDFESKTPSEVVVAYWHDACHRAMRMRADIPPSYERDFKADAIEAARMSQTEAEDCWNWIIDDISFVPVNKELAEFAAHTGRMSGEQAAAVLGKGWESKPRTNRRMRQQSLAKLSKIAAEQEKTGALVTPAEVAP